MLEEGVFFYFFLFGVSYLWMITDVKLFGCSNCSNMRKNTTQLALARVNPHPPAQNKKDGSILGKPKTLYIKVYLQNTPRECVPPTTPRKILELFMFVGQMK
jgi:hypothetical protein